MYFKVTKVVGKDKFYIQVYNTFKINLMYFLNLAAKMVEKL